MKSFAVIVRALFVVVKVFEEARSKSPEPLSSASVSTVVVPFDVTFWFRSTPLFALNVNVDPAVSAAF